jgi:DNA-binding transcriptional regulator YiaG
MKSDKKTSKALNPSVGKRIISGLNEFKTALQNNEKMESRFTVRTVELDIEPYAYTGDDVRKIREQLHVSQAIFAQILCVSVAAVRSWEQNKRTVPGIACRLMDDIRDEPQRWLRRLNQLAHHGKQTHRASA